MPGFGQKTKPAVERYLEAVLKAKELAATQPPDASGGNAPPTTGNTQGGSTPVGSISGVTQLLAAASVDTSSKASSGNAMSPQCVGTGGKKVLCLRVQERKAGEILGQLLNGFNQSVEMQMKLFGFTDKHSECEAVSLGRSVDLLVDHMGVEEFLECKASETMLRRLVALMIAKENKNRWEVAREVEETRAQMVPLTMVSAATKAANVTRKLREGKVAK